MPQELGFTFDPFELTGKEKPKKNVSKLKREMKDFIREEVLSYVGEGKSPVQNGAWQRTLSKDYKKKKSKYSSASFANMELKGDMLDALDVVESGSNLKLRVAGAKQAAKADGHNNHSGLSSLPPREFIPKEGQTFKRKIIQGLRDIIDKYDEPKNG